MYIPGGLRLPAPLFAGHFRLSNASLREVQNPVRDHLRTVWTTHRQAPRQNDPAILRSEP